MKRKNLIILALIVALALMFTGCSMLITKVETTSPNDSPQEVAVVEPAKTQEKPLTGTAKVSLKGNQYLVRWAKAGTEEGTFDLTGKEMTCSLSDNFKGSVPAKDADGMYDYLNSAACSADDFTAFLEHVGESGIYFDLNISGTQIVSANFIYTS